MDYITIKTLNYSLNFRSANTSDGANTAKYANSANTYDAFNRNLSLNSSISLSFEYEQSVSDLTLLIKYLHIPLTELASSIL